MATTDFTTLRRELGRFLGYGEMMGKDGTIWTTTTIPTGVTTLISTELRDYGFDDFEGAGSGDDLFQNWWVRVGDISTGGTSANSGKLRRIAAYDASAGQHTIAGTALAAETANVEFELHKYSPTLLREVLNTARVQAFPALYMPVSRTLFTATGQVRYELPSPIIGKPTAIWLEAGVPSTHANNLLSNADFDTFAGGAFTSWSAETGITLAQETATTNPKNYGVFRDGNAAKLTNGTTGTARDFFQTISDPGNYSGKRLNFSVWVYSLTATTITTVIDVNGTETAGTTGGGGVHFGNGWELLTQTADLTTTASTLKVGVRLAAAAATGTVIYVDEAICVIGPTQEPEDYSMLLQDWELVPILQGSTLRNEVVFPSIFNDMYRLRFEGRAYLSSVTAETDTMEIGSPQTQLLYAYAAKELYRRLSQSGATTETEYYRELIRQADHRIEEYSGFGVMGPKHKMKVPDGG